MTATDELRRLLDERGVEYELTAWSCGAAVWWRDSSGTMWRAHDNEEDELLSFYAYNSVTPGQAIAATLGKEPDDAAMLKLHDRMNAALLEYERALGSEKADGAITVPFVADMHHLLEEAATLGAGTCHPIISDNLTESEGMGDAWADCSECGHLLFVLTDPNSEVPNYCPNCGAKVVDA